MSAYDPGFASYWGGQHAADRRGFSGRLYVRRKRLDGGGYLRGRYFGTGAPLYLVMDDDGDVEFYIRAADHAGAEAIVRSGYPNARFARGRY